MDLLTMESVGRMAAYLAQAVISTFSHFYWTPQSVVKK
jgi:hypothetical protein